MKLYVALSLFILLGLENVESRSVGGSPLIVGGSAAEQGQFPYQLAIKLRGAFSCGASLVQVDDIQLAITAAQCMTSGSIVNYALVAGEFNLEETSGHEQTVDIMRAIFYPNYENSPPYHDDIALLFIRSPFQLNDFVQTIPLPEEGKIITGGNLTVAGWGKLWQDGPSPNLLHYVSIPVVNQTDCKMAWEEYGSEITEGQLCAGEESGGVSTCNGDTGGAAISEDGYLAGIVSWRWGCGHPRYPGIFTRVSKYVDWISNSVAEFKNNQL